MPNQAGRMVTSSGTTAKWARHLIPRAIFIGYGLGFIIMGHLLLVSRPSHRRYLYYSPSHEPGYESLHMQSVTAFLLMDGVFFFPFL
jgi:hypothetical protein